MDLEELCGNYAMRGMDNREKKGWSLLFGLWSEAETPWAKALPRIAVRNCFDGFCFDMPRKALLNCAPNYLLVEG